MSTDYENCLTLLEDWRSQLPEQMQFTEANLLAADRGRELNQLYACEWKRLLSTSNRA